MTESKSVSTHSNKSPSPSLARGVKGGREKKDFFHQVSKAAQGLMNHVGFHADILGSGLRAFKHGPVM